MTSATRVMVSTFGVIAGLAGIEHGVGEVRQGNVAPDGLTISSWPDSEVFEILNGEPAMTVVPNLLASGILTILVSLAFLVWVIFFVQRKHSGLVVLLLSVVMLLVGGGFGPPLLGAILGVAATRIDAPLLWWRLHLSPGSRRSLARVWPWSLAAGVVAWLAVMPGTILLDLAVGGGNPELVVPVATLTAFGLLFLAIAAGLARDVDRGEGATAGRAGGTERIRRAPAES